MRDARCARLQYSSGAYSSHTGIVRYCTTTETATKRNKDPIASQPRPTDREKKHKKQKRARVPKIPDPDPNPIHPSPSTQVLPPTIHFPPARSHAHTPPPSRPHSALRHPRRYGPPTLLPLASVTAYSCFSGSQLSAQLGTARRPRTPIRIACGFANAGGGGALGERSCGLLCAVSYRVDVQDRGGKGRRGGGDAYLALSVGPSASRAKLCGKSGLPGPRSPTTSYGISLLVVDEA